MQCKQIVTSKTRAPELRNSAGAPRSVRNVAVFATGPEEQYIGFKKGDYAPREGRKGRVIKDDPRKYPTKNALTGGWAGGEAGLWQLREQIKAEGDKSEEPKPYTAPVPKAGAVPIYVGFGKSDDEFKLRSSGGVGRVVYDTEEKYPAKEDVGPFPGVVGGFAGGERGIKAFVEGDMKIRKQGQVASQPGSPLTTGFVILMAGAVGGVLLSLVSPEIFESTKGSVEELGINFAIGGVLFGVLAGGAMYTSSQKS
ncbi:hypothetical protein FOA52_002823 [Chlamydomonas sp. UWO 241]|nr:hypothetical protein FOA52_002823 [Chlamydomonas sp. UWO 241]